MLTKKQKKVFEFIKSFSEKNGISPTYKEIASYIKVSSSNTVHDHLVNLAREGLITIKKNQPRGIEITEFQPMIEIPLVGEIAAGKPIEAVEDRETISVPRNKVPQNKKVFALKVVGNSMIDEGINNGDVVLVKQEYTAENGQKVVALINNEEATLKKFYKEKNHIRLQPANKKVEPIIIRKDKDLKIQGIVLDVMHPEREDSDLDSKKGNPPLNKIITGDVIKVMRKIPDESMHLAITSPPYNVGKNYDSHNDEMSYHDYLNWLYEVWKETKRVLVPGGRFALNIAPTGIKKFVPLHHDFTNQFRKLGMKFRTEIIWYKQTMLKRTAWGSFKSPSNPHIVPSWEYVLIFSKDQNKLEGNGNGADISKEEFMKFSDGLWEISPETKRNGHPAPFPEELIYRLIKFYSFKGNNVLDMFGGTGTVAAVSAKTGRNFIHIDISSEYNKTTRERVEKILNQKELV